MNDTLEARIKACEEMVVHSQNYWLRYFLFHCSQCVEVVAAKLGCTDACSHASVYPYFWHGQEDSSPTPETLVFWPVREDGWDRSQIIQYDCPDCGAGWKTLPFHQPATADFDEAAERARLIPQPEMVR